MLNMVPRNKLETAMIKALRVYGLYYVLLTLKNMIIAKAGLDYSRGETFDAQNELRLANDLQKAWFAYRDREFNNKSERDKRLIEKRLIEIAS